MIQSTDNLEATNYSHQCGDILVSKLRKLNKTNSTAIECGIELKDQLNCKSKKAESFCEVIKQSLIDKSTDQSIKRSTNRTTGRSSSERTSIRKSERISNRTTSEKEQSTRSNQNNKLNLKVNEKTNLELNDKLNTNSIDLINKSNLKSNDKLTDKSTDKSTNNRLNHLSTKQIDKKNHKKREKKLPINNRKRSDIENIFDLNSIKRVKAEMSNSNRPLVFCGPSGSGKSSLLKKLRNDYPDYFGFSISHTTRSPRAGEVHGQDYYYVTREEMLKAIDNDEFIENAEFTGNIYGTSKKAVEDVRSKGKICILDIEIEGVKNVKKSHLNPVYIFIKPPNIDELENRLRKRGSETEEGIQRRLRRAKDEIAFGEVRDNFDLLLVNDDFDLTYEKLKSFVLKCYGLPDKRSNDTNDQVETNNS